MMSVKPWQERRAGFYLRTENGIRESRRVHVRRFVAWLRTELTIEHYVPVYVVNAKRLRHAMNAHKARGSLGLFWFPNDAIGSRTPATIYVAARQKSTRQVLVTLAHEAQHYAEWARTGDTTERGKDSAARRLIYKYEREVLHDSTRP